MDSFELFHRAWPPLVAFAAVAFLYVVSYATLTLCGFRYLRLSIGVTTARMLAAVIVMFTCLLVLVVLWPAADLRVAHTFDRITLRTVAQHGDTTYFVDLVAGDDTAAYMDGNCGRDGLCATGQLSAQASAGTQTRRWPAWRATRCWRTMYALTLLSQFNRKGFEWPPSTATTRLAKFVRLSRAYFRC